MCNRFKQSKRAGEVAEHFQAWDEIEDTPRYNVAPTDKILVVRQQSGKRRIGSMRWGLIPKFATAIGKTYLIARSEDITRTPAFRDLVKSNRCLIPADAFYEWRAMGGIRQPYAFELKSQDLFAIAGLFDTWQGPTQTVESCVILTIEPNSLVADIHDRMPVIVQKRDYDLWLNSEDVKAALQVLKPFDENLMKRYPVSRDLNNPKNDNPQSAAEITLEAQIQGTLFE
jgi:putative SOS response-associated peptidase YedK